VLAGANEGSDSPVQPKKNWRKKEFDNVVEEKAEVGGNIVQEDEGKKGVSKHAKRR
jgi:hypothetical protein